jgi:hypothetical protein
LAIAGRPQAGNSLKYVGSSSQMLINVPERRFVVESTVTAEAGRVFGGAPSRFGKLIGRIDTTWRPVTVRLRSGAVLGTAPVDEFFVLGLDRDHELWLRATPERAGVRSFVLANVDVLKEVYDWSLFDLSVGPFVDAAHASRWLVDTGMQVRLGVLGAFSASLSFGRNLRTGENIWFATTSH